MEDNGNRLDSKDAAKVKFDNIKKGATEATSQIGDKAGVVIDKVKSSDYSQVKDRITSSRIFNNDDEPIAKIYTFIAAVIFLFPALGALTQLSRNTWLAVGIIFAAGLSALVIYIIGQITSNSIKARNNSVEAYKKLYEVNEKKFTGDITVIVSGFFFFFFFIAALVGVYTIFSVLTNEATVATKRGLLIYDTVYTKMPMSQRLARAGGVFASMTPVILLSYSMSKIVSSVREAEFYTKKIKQYLMSDAEK